MINYILHYLKGIFLLNSANFNFCSNFNLCTAVMIKQSEIKQSNMFLRVALLLELNVKRPIKAG